MNFLWFLFLPVWYISCQWCVCKPAPHQPFSGLSNQAGRSGSRPAERKEYVQRDRELPDVLQGGSAVCFYIMYIFFAQFQQCNNQVSIVGNVVVFLLIWFIFSAFKSITFLRQLSFHCLLLIKQWFEEQAGGTAMLIASTVHLKRSYKRFPFLIFSYHLNHVFFFFLRKQLLKYWFIFTEATT